MSTSKHWNDVSIQVPLAPPASTATPFKSFKAIADKINLQAELAKFATAAQLGQFTYSFGTFLNEKSAATDVVCVNCEKSTNVATPPSGWVLVSGTQWKFTTPTKEVVDIYLFPLDKMTPLGKVGECLLLSVDGKASGMTQGIVVNQGVAGLPGGQLWGLIPAHGLIGTPATRQVSCCAAAQCPTCLAGQCYPTCLFGQAQPKINPTPKKMLATYQLRADDVVPLYLSQGRQALTTQVTPAGIPAYALANYTAAIALLQSVVDVDLPITVDQLRKLSAANDGRPLVAFKKGMITGWTIGRITLLEDVRITVTPFGDEIIANRGDCGSPWFVVEPAGPTNDNRARARLFGYAYAAYLERNKYVEVAAWEVAIARLKALAPGPYMLEPAKTYRWAAA